MEILGLIDLPIWLLVIILVPVLFVVHMTWGFNKFRDIGVDGPPPSPFFGHIHSMFFKKGLVFCDRDWYKKYDKVYGTFEGKLPVLNIGKPELIKEILVKEFSSFVNRRNDFNNALEKPLDQMLTQLQDDHWKFVRRTLTPGFSAKKLRGMSDLINLAIDRLLENLKDKAIKEEDVELKELFGAYTLESLSSTAFGMQIDSQKNPDNPFLVTIKRFFKPTVQNFIILIVLFFPFMAPLVQKASPRKNWIKVFTDAILQTIKHREENPGEYNDLLQQMIDSQKAGMAESDEEDNNEDTEATKTTWTRKGLTESEILSQSLLIFFAGYMTTTDLLVCFLHQLAIDPETCMKIQEEIDVHLDGERPNYDNVRKLSYLEMCISETLRMHSVPRTDRSASKDVVIGNIPIKKGTVVAIPIGAIHYDENVWPDPEKFLPERFTPEAKAARDPFTYLPFGQGPRNCIGSRLALMQAKMTVVSILQKYTPVKCEQTKIPISKNNLRWRPMENWIRFESRS